MSELFTSQVPLPLPHTYGETILWERLQAYLPEGAPNPQVYFVQYDGVDKVGQPWYYIHRLRMEGVWDTWDEWEEAWEDEGHVILEDPNLLPGEEVLQYKTSRKGFVGVSFTPEHEDAMSSPDGDYVLVWEDI